MNNYAERAQRGAQLLDDIRPDWAFVIDVETLEITYFSSCILGQIYGNFISGADKIGMQDDRDRQELHGFELTYEEYTSEDPNTYTGWDLRAAWLNEISKRI